MYKRVLIVSLLAFAAVLALSACTSAPSPTAQPPTAAPVQPTQPPPSTGKALKVGLVLDTGGPDDKSFNQSAVGGLNKAKTELGLDPASKYLESRQQTDYVKNMEEFANQGFDMIIGVGFLMGTDLATEAKAHPKIKFAIIDAAYPDCGQGQTEGKDCGSAKVLDNAVGLLSKVEETTFMAGYISAAVSKTKKVGTYGGIKFAAVTDFMVGFEGGVKYWNQKHNDKVQLLGWSTADDKGVFTNDFNDPGKGQQATLSLIDEGADVVLPVSGQEALGTFTAAKDKKVKAIGVDVDQCLTVPDACPILLTSIIKNVGADVYNVIKQAQDGTYKGGVFTGTLANGGLALAPFHDNASLVSSSLQSELDQIKADIIAGKIDIRAIAKGQ